jgi:hypothetical protein
MDDTEEQLMTYNTGAFKELQSLFVVAEKLYEAGKQETMDLYKILPPGIISFIEEKEWSDRIAEIKNNTSSHESFMKRFFSWFNIFRIVKYMNHVHSGIFNKKAVADSAFELLRMSGSQYASADPEKLLLYYRSLEKDIQGKS